MDKKTLNYVNKEDLKNDLPWVMTDCGKKVAVPWNNESPFYWYFSENTPEDLDYMFRYDLSPDNFSKEAPTWNALMKALPAQLPNKLWNHHYRLNIHFIMDYNDHGDSFSLEGDSFSFRIHKKAFTKIHEEYNYHKQVTRFIKRHSEKYNSGFMRLLTFAKFGQWLFIWSIKETAGQIFIEGMTLKEIYRKKDPNFNSVFVTDAEEIVYRGIHGSDYRNNEATFKLKPGWETDSSILNKTLRLKPSTPNDKSILFI